MQQVFKEIPLNTCEVREGLHLKSSMSMLAEDTILIGRSEAAQSIKKQILEKSPFAHLYKFVEVDEDQSGSANVLYFNNTLMYPSSFEHIYKSNAEFQNNQVEFKSLKNDEFKKIDGCLTCRSVFFNKGSNL